MDIEQALRDTIKTTPGLTNQVYLLTADEGIKCPFMIITSSEGERIKTLEGYLSTRKTPIEFNLVCESYKDMKTRQRVLMDSLFSWAQNSKIGESFNIKSLSYESPVEMFEPEVQMYRCQTRVQIVY